MNRHIFFIVCLLSVTALHDNNLYAHGDHSDEQLAHWEIASKYPDRIFLSFYGDPAYSRAVAWRTSTDFSRAYLEVAPALGESRFDKAAVRIEAKTEAFDINESTFNIQGIVHYHSAIIGNLQPDTLYAYRVGDGEEIWSEWIQFRTAHAEPRPFKFVYFGDAQNSVLSHWSRVIRMAYQTAPDAPIAIHAGDLVNRAHRDYEWAEWFKAGSFLHAQWTGFPVPGNHEYDRLDREAQDAEKILSHTWRGQFELPVEEELPEILHETVYTVDFQGVQFIALNSNREQEAQIPWLKKQLQKKGPRWRVVTFHHPIFSPGNDRDNPELRDAWKPIFDEYGVDLVLQGHDHTYARGQVPVQSHDGVFKKDTFQTMYVTSVSGPKMYEIREGKFDSYGDEHGLVPQRQAENTQFFQVIEVDGNTITYSAYTAVGELYDQAVITKDFASGVKIIEQKIPDVPRRTHANTLEYSRD